MITAYFDVQPAKPKAKAPRRPDPPAPKASEAATTSVLAKFEALAPETNVPRAAEQPGRQQWQGLLDTETKDDDLAEWNTVFMEDDDEEGHEEDDDVSEPDFEVDSLDCCETAGPGTEMASSVEDLAPLRAVFGTRRQRRVAAQQQPHKAMYGGPLLCCDAEDEFY